jgi:HEAT repeat protein
MSSNHNNSNGNSNSSANDNGRNVTSITSVSPVAALKHQLRSCRFSDDYVVVIRALVATRDPAAIRVLASLLDSTGPIAEESIAGLVTFGEAAIPAMRECVESLDYEMIRHAHRVLEALGDEDSETWICEDDEERIAAYMERKGFDDDAADRFRTAFGTNDPDEWEEIA